jgi:hypothetical protein
MAVPTPGVDDINTVIASAVQARIEAQVAAALADSDSFTMFVTGALQQEITVRENFRDRKTTFLAEQVREAVREATKLALKKALDDEVPKLEALVKKALKANVDQIATGLVGNLVDRAGSPYGITVQVNYPSDS